MEASSRSFSLNESSEENSSCLIKRQGRPICFHGTIDWDVAKRFLAVLYQKGPTNRTNLAMYSGLNYDASKRYVMWAMEVDWIVEKEGKIVLTDAGLAMCERLLLD